MNTVRILSIRFMHLIPLTLAHSAISGAMNLSKIVLYLINKGARFNAIIENRIFHFIIKTFIKYIHLKNDL